MLKPIDPSDFEAAHRLLCEGFPERDAAFWKSGLERLFSHGENSSLELPYGYFMMDKAEPVGVAIMPASQRRQADGGHRRIMNVSSWYVRAEHRWRAPMMLRGLFADSSLIYTDLTPTPDVQKMLPVFGFKPINLGLMIEPLAALAMRDTGSAKVRGMEPGSAPEGLAITPGQIETHRALGLVPLLITHEGTSQVVLHRRTSIRGMPAAQLVYVESHKALAPCMPALARHLLWRGKMFLISECRDEASAESRFFRPRGIWFARNDSFEDRTDYLGSELCILDL